MSGLTADQKHPFCCALLDQCFQMQHVMQLRDHGRLSSCLYLLWVSAQRGRKIKGDGGLVHRAQLEYGLIAVAQCHD
jgi:hypothetical protein